MDRLQSPPILWPQGRQARWAITLDWAIVGGRAEAVGMHVEPVARVYEPEQGQPTPPVEALTTSLLREIPLAQLVARERRRMARELRVAGLDRGGVARAQAELVRDARSATKRAKRTGERIELDLVDYLPEGDLPPKARKLLRALERKGPGRKPEYGPDHFAVVANVYLEAWKRGDHPTKAVMEQGPGAPVSKSTAAKWVARARDLGFLAPTTRGRAGGVPKPKPAKQERSPKKTKPTKKAKRSKGGRKPPKRGRGAT